MTTSSPQRQSQALKEASATPKRRTNDLLRNYYGLSRPSSSSSASPPPRSNVTRLAGPPDTEDPQDPDSSRFDSKVAFEGLLREKGLAQLLGYESDLLTEIRELDGERQSLVYNHHHELVAASETIHKMKDRADALTPSLSSLQQSLREISQTSKALQIPIEFLPRPLQPEPIVGNNPSKSAGISSEEVERLVAPIVELPRRLSELILLGDPSASPLASKDGTEATEHNSEGLAAAERLWGRMEAVLSTWVDAGIPGAKEISNECRAVLRGAQQGLTSSSVVV